MPELKDKVIKKVYENKSGTNSKGPWTAYNFYLEGGELKFSYFKTKDTPTPSEGVIVKSMIYSKVEKDGYTNYNVSKLVLGERTQPQQGSTTGTPKTFIDHGKCVIDLMKLSNELSVDLVSLIDEFKMGISCMIAPISHNAPPTQNDGPPEDELGDPGYDSSDIRFDDIPF